MQSVSLDIFADPVCPWCLIGKAQLDRALESRPGHPFAITWHPYRLDPSIPTEGVPYVDYMLGKFRDEKGILEAMAPVMRTAERLGLWINPALIQRIPNTIDAHRLMLWAGLEGCQTPVIAALMRAHWREGKYIGDHQVLADIAAASGMDRAMILRLLSSDADRDQVLSREVYARQRGVTAVPTFIVDNTHAISGAQPVELWQNVIDELTGSPPPQGD